MKQRTFKKWLAAVLLALTVLVSGCSSSLNEEASSLGTLGTFSAQTLDGAPFTNEDLGKYDLMVLNFWTTTCGPCISEMPDLAEFEQALPDNVRFATVCLDAQGNEDAVKTILNEAGYEGLTLTGGDGDYASVCGKVQATPTTVLVLPDGTFVGDIVLGTQEDFSGTMLKAINQALSDAGKAEITLDA